jgi:ribosomal protein S1
VRRYPQGRACSEGHNLADYGAFVEIEQGIEVGFTFPSGLTVRTFIDKVVQARRRVEVAIPEIDEERRRISLRNEAVHAQSVGRFFDESQEGRQGEGLIRVTDFGVFIGLPGGDGPVHLSDLSVAAGEAAVRDYRRDRKSRQWCLQLTSSASVFRSSSRWTATRSQLRRHTIKEPW